MIVFKIRNKKTGEYSKGTQYPSFNKKGKTWQSKGALNLHLANVSPWASQKYNTEDHEIVPIEIIQTELAAIPFSVHEEERMQSRQKRQQQEKTAAEKRAKDSRRKQFEELQKEFG